MPTNDKKRTWLADQPLQRKVVLAIGTLLVLFIADCISSLVSLERENQTRDWATHTYVVLLTLADVNDAAQTRQVGARGYMLNQADEEYAGFEAGDRRRRPTVGAQLLAASLPVGDVAAGPLQR